MQLTLKYTSVSLQPPLNVAIKTDWLCFFTLLIFFFFKPSKGWKIIINYLIN